MPAPFSLEAGQPPATPPDPALPHHGPLALRPSPLTGAPTLLSPPPPPAFPGAGAAGPGPGIPEAGSATPKTDPAKKPHRHGSHAPRHAHGHAPPEKPPTASSAAQAEVLRAELAALRARLQRLRQQDALIAGCQDTWGKAMAQYFSGRAGRQCRGPTVQCAISPGRLLLGRGVRSGWDTALAWVGLWMVGALLAFAVLLPVDAAAAAWYRRLPRPRPHSAGPTCPRHSRPADWNVTGARSCAQNEVMGYWTGIACSTCLPGWRGARCRQPCSDLWHCSGHGKCGEGGACVCFRGWEGEMCSDVAEDQSRLALIRDAFLESWEAYKRDAYGHDVLLPVSRATQDWVPGGMGLTLIDALDGLWMFGFSTEFQEAKEWVRQHLTFDVDCTVSIFETTIRVLGGLLAAYTLDEDWVFVEKAVDLADRLLPGFASPTGVPYTHVNLRTGAVENTDWAPSSAILAEFGSIQLEFRYLSHLTNNPVYDRHVTRVMRRMEAAMPGDGLFPLRYNLNTGVWDSNHVSFGALGDSFYEYLLKQWLQTGKQEEQYRRMYNATVRGLRDQLLVRTRRHVFLAERQERVHHKMDHLSCFVPGMLALGSESDPEVLEVAEDLAKTCVQMYLQTATGIAPESTTFDPDEGIMKPGAKFYLLRPEVIESLFYLWRRTKKPIYRTWAWKIFTNIERHCRVETGGYSGLRDVTKVPAAKNDNMSSFWLAETLKYLYWIFAEDSALSLEAFVLNTEAHPFPVIPPLPPHDPEP